MSLRTAGERYSHSKDGLLNVFQEREFHLNIKVLVIGALLSLSLILGAVFLPKLLFQNESMVGGSVKFSSSLTNSQVLGICSQQPITRDFIVRNPLYQTEVTFLNQETLQGLAATSPAIYAGLPSEKGLYKVKYTGQEEGIMLLLNPKNKEVLKYYRVRTLTFP